MKINRRVVNSNQEKNVSVHRLIELGDLKYICLVYENDKCRITACLLKGNNHWLGQHFAQLLLFVWFFAFLFVFVFCFLVTKWLVHCLVKPIRNQKHSKTFIPMLKIIWYFNVKCPIWLVCNSNVVIVLLTWKTPWEN